MGELPPRMLSIDDRLERAVTESHRIRGEIQRLNASYELWEFRRALREEAQRSDPLYGYETPRH